MREYDDPPFSVVEMTTKVIPVSGTGPGTGKKSGGKYAVTFTFLSGLGSDYPAAD